MRALTGASPDPAVEARLDAVMNRLYGFYHTEVDLSLDRTYRFLEKLGNPHLRLPKTVHVAGTNGKGSTVATLFALLTAAGQKVHVYTSPHLVHPTERIRLAGTPIHSDALVALLNECIEINDGAAITFFEMFTCAALLWFSRVQADWLILETGMGGRLDTTNVIPDPVATIITTISYDHQKFLGNTLPLIAREKAGIMKPGVPCIIGYQFDSALKEGVLDVFQDVSQNLSTEAPLLSFGAEWSSAPESGQMLFRYGNDSILTQKPALYGNHQIWNAGAALAAFRTIAPGHFREPILSTGLGQIHWPARLQRLENHPYSALVPENWEIILDGGHNDSAGTVLAAQMEEWRKSAPRPCTLIVAMVNRKDAGAFLRPLLPYADRIILTEIENEATTYTAAQLEVIAKEVGFREVFAVKTPEEAVRLAARLSKTDQNPAPQRIIIAGSLFLAGNILKINN